MSRFHPDVSCFSPEDSQAISSLIVEDTYKMDTQTTTTMRYGVTFDGVPAPIMTVYWIHNASNCTTLEPYIRQHEGRRPQRHATNSFLYSPITYSQPSSPIHTSCSLPAGTSTLAPTPNVSFDGEGSLGYVIVKLPLRMRWVVKPECECGR